MLRVRWQHLTRRRSDDLAFGCDAARVQLTERPGSAVVVCVDARCDSAGAAQRPRILVTLLLVNERGALQEEAAHALELHKMQRECSLSALFDGLPKYWSPVHYSCLEQCLLLLSPV